MRIAMVDNLAARNWSGMENRFRPLAGELADAGYEIVFLDAPTPMTAPMIAGSEKAGDILPLVAAASLVEPLKDINADMIVCTLRGGIAHGVLMARACGEFPTDCRIAIWCDTPTRNLLLDGDAIDQSLSPLVADALERACIEMADAVLAPHESRVLQLHALEVDLPRILIGPPTCVRHELRSASVDEPVQEIVFVGALERGCGAVAFIDAIERLAAMNLLGDRQIAFAGPIRNAPNAPGQEWLGLRATQWRFRFTVFPTLNYAEALNYGLSPGRLAVVAAHDPEDFAFDDRCVLVDLSKNRPNCCSETIANLIAGRLSGENRAARQIKAQGDWPSMVETLAKMPARKRTPRHSPVGISVCIVHFERPELLAIALASVQSQVIECEIEIILVDNASRSPESQIMLDQIEAAGNVRMIRLVEPLAYPVAYNHAAKLARNEFLVFLDDDNILKPGGLVRLHRAAAFGQFDVIVSNLDLFDSTAGQSSDPLATLVFIGPARSAGLFFNGFGDTCLAFSREAFLELGGFSHSLAPYPVADWILLARAQANGLKIGVLQEPAYRYRRSEAQSMWNWQKFDQQGARSLVLQSYGNAFDTALIVKFAQGLWLRT